LRVVFGYDCQLIAIKASDFGFDSG
jgi:hypothetical protein